MQHKPVVIPKRWSWLESTYMVSGNTTTEYSDPRSGPQARKRITHANSPFELRGGGWGGVSAQVNRITRCLEGGLMRYGLFPSHLLPCVLLHRHHLASWATAANRTGAVQLIIPLDSVQTPSACSKPAAHPPGRPIPLPSAGRAPCPAADPSPRDIPAARAEQREHGGSPSPRGAGTAKQKHPTTPPPRRQPFPAEARGPFPPCPGGCCQTSLLRRRRRRR